MPFFGAGLAHPMVCLTVPTLSETPGKPRFAHCSTDEGATFTRMHGHKARVADFTAPGTAS